MGYEDHQGEELGVVCALRRNSVVGQIKPGFVCDRFEQRVDCSVQFPVLDVLGKHSLGIGDGDGFVRSVFYQRAPFGCHQRQFVEQAFGLKFQCRGVVGAAGEHFEYCRILIREGHVRQIEVGLGIGENLVSQDFAVFRVGLAVEREHECEFPEAVPGGFDILAQGSGHFVDGCSLGAADETGHDDVFGKVVAHVCFSLFRF